MSAAEKNRNRVFGGLLTAVFLLIPASCGDIVTGYKEPAIDTGQLTAVAEDDATTGTAIGIYSGKDHHCAVFSTGNVRCWGKNTYGQLGYGNTSSIGDDEDPLSAGDVNVGCTVSSMALGAEHTCALCNSGKVRCWGNGASGQLGYASTGVIGDNELPYLSGEVLVGTTATQIAAGAAHTCALTAAGNVRCWGSSAKGQLGYANTTTIGDSENPSTAGNVNIGGTATALTAGAAHTCALMSTGAVRCWGSGEKGVLGYGSTDNIGDDETPDSAGDVSLGGTATAISSAYLHTCALMESGRIRCWGDNSTQGVGFVDTSNNVGDDETPEDKGDARVEGKFTKVVVGYLETCGLLNDDSGNWRCWGGTPDVPFGIPFSTVSGGDSNWCGIHSSGRIRCAGLGTDGRLGNGSPSTVAVWPSVAITVETPGYTQDDPLFQYQWHITNTGVLGGTPGEDANVAPVWLEGNRGDDVLVAVVDDGLEITHPDLYANALIGSSYNYTNGSTDPGGTSASHGTCVGGIIGARDKNGFGVRGIAPRSKLVGYNMLQASTVANIADSMTRNSSSVFVSNNSWGPTDAVGSFTTADSTWQTAVNTAITSGRGGKGTSFFFAAGNGRRSLVTPFPDTDRSTYDGYASYWGVTAVCAVGDDGTVATYSEPGSNVWVCGHSQGSAVTAAVYTTDLVGIYGFNTNLGSDITDRAYTAVFNGTSAAAPMISGVAALMYKANPNLTWRDTRLILAKSAASSAAWGQNGATPAYNISYDFGFGIVDADAAVQMAKTWTNVGALKTVQQPTSAVQAGAGAVADNGTSATSTITASGTGISKIEFVQVELNLSHTDWGNLDIQLERSGAITTISRLAVQHQCYDSATAPQAHINCSVSGNTFKFGTARHLGEPADGDWTLVIKDQEADTKTGTFTSWRLTFYGE